MKTLNSKFLGLVFFAFIFLISSESLAQATSCVGNWQSSTPIAISNNTILRIKILSTSNPDVFIIINPDNPKKKIIAKYNTPDGRLYATVKNIPIYFIYISSSDSLECYNVSTNAIISDFTRY
jgi:hypothetical protein